MRKKLMVLIGLLTITAVITGCPADSKKISTGLKDALAEENAAFIRLTNAQNEIGNSVAKAQKRYIAALEKVHSKLRKLNSRLEDNSDEVEGAKNKFVGFDNALIRLFDRSGKIKLKVAPWDYVKTLHLNDKIPVLRSKILTDYMELHSHLNYQKPNQQLGDLKIEVTKNKHIRSQKEACIKIFDYVRLGQSDTPDCKKAARELCTHQTNVDCVQKNVNIHSSKTCTRYTKVYRDRRGYPCQPTGDRKVDGGCSLVKERIGTASWLNYISKCESDVPYCNYGSGLQLCKVKK